MKNWEKFTWGVVFGVLIACCIQLVFGTAHADTPPHYWP